LRVQPYYRDGAIAELDYLESLPGVAPYHRGHSSTGNAWSIVQEIGLTAASQANAAAKEALEGGADAVCFVSRPADVGVHGVNLQSLDAMRALIQGLPVYRAAIHFRGGAFALPHLANFLAAVKAGKADPTDIQGSVDYDPLATLVTVGEASGSREQMFFEVARVVEQSASLLPQFRVLSIQGGAYLEAGGSAVQEIAFTLAALAEYLQGLRSGGLDLSLLLPRLQVQFSVGSTYFMEIAKMRAARMLISRVLEAFLGDGVAAPAVPIVARGADFNKAIYDPHTNLLRATTEAMAAAIGGANAMMLAPFDASYRTPNAMSLRLARNIQLLLKHEAYLDKVADPAAGAYLFESLTDSLAKEAWTLFQKVETMGGFFSAAANGFLKEDISVVAMKKRDAIGSRRYPLLGVNQYPNAAEAALPRVDCESTVSELLPNQHTVAVEEVELLASLREGYLAGAVLGDVLAALDKSESQVAVPLQTFRAAEAYEALRLRTEQHAARTGVAPTVFLFKMGDVAMRQARAGFVSNFFGCAGFAISDNLGFSSVEGAVAAAVNAKADIVVFCSSDDEYLPLVQQASPLLRQQLPQCQLVVAGYPKDALDALSAAGVQDFVHVRTVALESLGNFQRKMGIVPQQ
jgi:methylmalonyl-CoA mutase